MLLISLSLLGIAIVVVLSIIAFGLTRQVKAQEKLQQEKAEQEKNKLREQREYVAESLRIIALNVIEEDLNLSEATIRSKVLIDSLNFTVEERAPYEVIEEVYEKIKGFDTHQARKALAADERKKQDIARQAVEQEYEQDLKNVFQQLRHFYLTH